MACLWLPVLSACATPTLEPTPAAGLPDSPEGGGVMDFHIQSDVFGSGGPIPGRFTCDGEDVSPPLTWGGVPEGAASLALIMDDPDAPAGIWIHWVLYDIPAGLNGLPEGVPADELLSDGRASGLNSWQRNGYGGPCPPSGTHRYFFRLYALDKMLGLPAGTTKDGLLDAMQGHILGQTEVMGTYARLK